MSNDPLEECRHELIKSSCSVCAPRQAVKARATRFPAMGPWITAAYDGRCVSDCSILKGDQIRGDGAGNWMCSDCGLDAEAEGRELRGPGLPVAPCDALGFTDDVFRYGDVEDGWR